MINIFKKRSPGEQLIINRNKKIDEELYTFVNRIEDYIRNMIKDGKVEIFNRIADFEFEVNYERFKKIASDNKIMKDFEIEICNNRYGIRFVSIKLKENK